MGRIIILSGPSGVGKTTLQNMLLKHVSFKDLLVRSISATTRKPRGEEKHGIDYYFLSRKMFEYKIRAGHFLEWAKVFDNYYGTLRKMVADSLEDGKNVLLSIDVQGGLRVKNDYPNALMVFITTSNVNKLYERLNKRGTDSCDCIKHRLAAAQKEIQCAKYYDHVICNDELNVAFNSLSNLIQEYISTQHVR